MFVLAIDTSSPAVVVGIVDTDGNPGWIEVASRAPEGGRRHGELLTPAIAECLTDAGLSPRDVHAVVAGLGPGPYTGLRVGMVTAAAFADAIGVPSYGVCSLDAIGETYSHERSLLVATDARRREVYWARYEYGWRVGDIGVDRPEDVVLDGIEAFAAPADLALPEGWAALRRTYHQNPDPVMMAVLADRSPLDEGARPLLDGTPGEPLTPLYLRRPDAVVPGAPKTVRQ